jgi:hypothetical protein
MATAPRVTRQEIATTVSSTTFAYLEQSDEDGKPRNLADAIDLAVEQSKVYENRERLANGTAAYFDNMTDEEAAEEQKLEAAISQSASAWDRRRNRSSLTVGWAGAGRLRLSCGCDEALCFDRLRKEF